MEMSTKVAVPDHVMARQVGEETVILDLAGGTYYSLDPVGSRVWQLLIPGATPAQVCEAMLREFDVEAADLERDVLALMRSLIDRKLVVPAG
jgi:hypothetical protein